MPVREFGARPVRLRAFWATTGTLAAVAVLAGTTSDVGASTSSSPTTTPIPTTTTLCQLCNAHVQRHREYQRGGPTRLANALFQFRDPAHVHFRARRKLRL